MQIGTRDVRQKKLLRTSFVNIRQVDFNSRIPSLVAKDHPILRRCHVRENEDAGLPREAWCGEFVAADARRVIGNYYIEIVVAT